MTVPSAEKMADIVWSIGEKLLETKIVEDQSIVAFSQLR